MTNPGESLAWRGRQKDPLLLAQKVENVLPKTFLCQVMRVRTLQVELQKAVYDSQLLKILADVTFALGTCEDVDYSHPRRGIKWVLIAHVI